MTNKAKYLGDSPEEDRVVDIPEATPPREVTAEPEVVANSPWPAVLVFCTFMVCIVAIVWIIHG